MNESEHNSPFDDALLPGASDQHDTAGGAEEIATQQLVHGLLRHAHLDDSTQQHQRIENVMASITEDDSASTAPVLRRLRFPRWVALAASAAAIILIIIFSGVPTERTALAVVQQTIDAAANAGDRSYAIKANLPQSIEIDPAPHGRIDIRDSDHILLQLEPQDQPPLIVGRNADGAWALRPDGSIDRYPPEWVWPRWFELGERSLLIESVDQLLIELPLKYDLHLEPDMPAPGTQAPVCLHVVAERMSHEGAEPIFIKLWVNPDSHIVHRIELHWDPPRHPDAVDGFPPSPAHDGPPPPAHDGPPHLRGHDRALEGGAMNRPPHEPRRAPGGHQPRPGVMVFELIEVGTLPSDWFDPESHD